MTRYKYFAFSDCKDPAREDEYNDWYENTHIPDMLATPGMISATRWVAAEKKDDGIRKYVVIYEFETDDMEQFNRDVATRGKWTFEQGRFSELPAFDPDNVYRIYEQRMEEKKAPGK